MIIYSWTAFRHHFNPFGDIGPDGVEGWPIDDVRAGGFDGGFSGIAEPITAFPIDVSVDGSASGALAYHAYLSQRTDDPDAQYLSIIRKSGKSGTFTIGLTALAVTELGLTLATDPVSSAQLIQALKYVTLYVQRLSDGAIQLVNLLDATLPDA